MPPKTHLALRRYTAESLVQGSSVGRGRLILHRLSGVGPAPPDSCEPAAEVLRVFACLPPGEEAPDLRLSLEAGVRFTSAACTINIHGRLANANYYFNFFSTHSGG